MGSDNSRIEEHLRELSESLVAIGILLAPDRLSTSIDESYMLEDPDGIMSIQDRLTCTSPLLREVISRRIPTTGESISVVEEDPEEDSQLTEEDRKMAEFMGIVRGKRPYRQWESDAEKLPEKLPKTEGKEKNIPSRKGWNPFRKDDPS